MSTEPIHQRIQVEFTYPVHFTTDLFSRGNLLLRNIVGAGQAILPKKLLCVIDRAVADCHPSLSASVERYCWAHGDFLNLVGSPLIIDGGERVKNGQVHVASIHDAINAFGLDRHAYVVAIGGGALLDMVGYAAATAHRGVRLIRVPTTVLSQNDSAVGVKNSINAYGKKNFLGTFAPPYAVLNDLHFLSTLSDRDWLGGISEAVKVALLKDVTFFQFLEAHADHLVRRDMAPMQWVIYRCAQLHLDHIATSGDPFELGSSRPLDFGHWAAHKLEQTSGYTIRHGEAVAIGIALDSTYSYLAGLLSKPDWERILNLFTALDLRVYAEELSLSLHDHADSRCVFHGLREFREHLGGQLTIMLLERIGKGVEVHEVNEAVLVDSIKILQEYQARIQVGESHGQACRNLPAEPARTD